MMFYEPKNASLGRYCKRYELTGCTTKQVEKYFVSKGIKVNEATLTPNKKTLLYSHPKIWIIRIQKMRWKQRIVCAFDDRKNTAGMKTLQIVVSPTEDVQYLQYLSGILSSKIINFWCTNYSWFGHFSSGFRKTADQLGVDNHQEVQQG